MKDKMKLFCVFCVFCGLTAFAQLNINLPTITVSSNDLPAVNFAYQRYADAFQPFTTNRVGTNEVVVTNILLVKKDFCAAQTTNWFFWNLQVNWWPEYARHVEARENLKSFMETYRQATEARQSNALAAALAILRQ